MTVSDPFNNPVRNLMSVLSFPYFTDEEEQDVQNDIAQWLGPGLRAIVWVQIPICLTYQLFDGGPVTWLF